MRVDSGPPPPTPQIEGEASRRNGKTGVAAIILGTGVTLAGRGRCGLASEMTVRRVDGGTSVTAPDEEDGREGRATVQYNRHAQTRRPPRQRFERLGSARASWSRMQPGEPSTFQYFGASRERLPLQFSGRLVRPERVFTTPIQ